jgi:hypothetical protein
VRELRRLGVEVRYPTVLKPRKPRKGVAGHA